MKFIKSVSIEGISCKPTASNFSFNPDPITTTKLHHSGGTSERETRNALHHELDLFADGVVKMMISELANKVSEFSLHISCHDGSVYTCDGVIMDYRELKENVVRLKLSPATNWVQYN